MLAMSALIFYTLAHGDYKRRAWLQETITNYAEFFLRRPTQEQVDSPKIYISNPQSYKNWNALSNMGQDFARQYFTRHLMNTKVNMSALFCLVVALIVTIFYPSETTTDVRKLQFTLEILGGIYYLIVFIHLFDYV